jgi:putative hydrolase of the HAD superfamily
MIVAMKYNNGNSIKVIIFDLGKVIVDFDHGTICNRLASYCSFTPEQIYSLAFTSKLEAYFDEGKITPQEFYKKTKLYLNIDIPREVFKKIWNEIFTLKSGIVPIISNLKPHYKLLCLSNTNPWHFNYCREQFPVLKLFDAFILSYKVGERKPHTRIFREAIKRAGALPHECLYIDDIEEYVKKAQELGMHAIHFVSIPQLKKDLKGYVLS